MIEVLNAEPLPIALSDAPLTEPAEIDELMQLGRLLKLLADPTRLRIFDLLMQGVQCNCELGGALGISPNLISHHLGVLRRAGLVAIERDTSDARWVYYSVDPMALRELRGALETFFDPARIQQRQPQCGPRQG